MGQDFLNKQNIEIIVSRGSFIALTRITIIQWAEFGSTIQDKKIRFQNLKTDPPAPLNAFLCTRNDQLLIHNKHIL